MLPSWAMKGEHKNIVINFLADKVMMVATLTSEWLPTSAVILIVSYWYKEKHQSEFSSWDSGKIISFLLFLCWAASELKARTTEQPRIIFSKINKSKWRHWSKCCYSLVLVPILKLVMNWTNKFGITALILTLWLICWELKSLSGPAFFSVESIW